jgi:hypothetical protein
MTRVAVLAAALTVIVGFAYLTVASIAAEGFSVETALAVCVLVVLTVGIIGSLGGPPRR